ncbi:MAG: SDR family oxidoreductase [Gammaproteobacteria bacterium]|nr:SDR family oxidoreductase [Gammaproteobacteria bacterium]
MTNTFILVTGATGTVGSEVVKQLVQGGHRVRAMVRDLAKAAQFGPKVEIVQGDLSKPEALAAAFVGVDKVYVVLPAIDPEFPELEGNAFNAAKKAGVKHIVKQSSVVATDFMAGTPFAEWHGASEKRLRAIGVAWTILRPHFFDSNVIEFGIVPRGGLFFPAGNGKDAPIDPRDIAAVAVKVLTTPGHEEKVYELTGPELLSFAEVVQKIATVTGKPLKYVDVPEATWREEMLSAGAPPPVVESLLAYFAGGVKAGRIHMTSTVSELLGRPPRALNQWAKDYIAALQ